MSVLERGSGVALWRQIANRLRAEISAENFESSGKLPNEIDLAKRYGVNRHTVRRAIAELTSTGLLEARRGEGTFVRQQLLDYRIGERTRFHEILAGQSRKAHGRLLSTSEEPAEDMIANALKVPEGTTLIRLETVHEADEKPVSTSTSWFVQSSFPDLVTDFEKSGSLSKALENAGFGGYRRGETTISSRFASESEIELLDLIESPIVVVNEYVNLSNTGEPIQFARSRFAASRVRFVIG